MMFNFTMLTADAKTIVCSISGAAMDRLAGKTGFLPSERAALFSDLRDKIEKVASDIFDKDGASQVLIFSKHVEPLIKKIGPPARKQARIGKRKVAFAGADR
jgi:hypothetical protein